jgi:2-polyprenyl-6-methoxyphenol hydroxylase-like FAD-dependent oxidoreductase
VGIRWPSRPNVTLLGDAAHLMSPFAGAGANLAMQDGAALALEIREASDPSVAIAAYEEKMFERAEEEAQRSADGLAMCISPNGSERFANWMERVQALHSAPHAT